MGQGTAIAITGCNTKGQMVINDFGCSYLCQCDTRAPTLSNDITT